LKLQDFNREEMHGDLLLNFMEASAV